MPFQLGALIEPFAVACHDVRLSRLRAGEHAVVIGGGPISVLIALAAHHLAVKVLVFEPNETQITLCEGLGLAVLNPLATNLDEEVANFSNGAMAEVVFEVSGVRRGARL